MNEVAVQYIVMTAHQPQGDPVADRQHNNANYTYLKHLGGLRLKAPMIQCLQMPVKPRRGDCRPVCTGLAGLGKRR